jgi:signal transduction histidine kinase
MKKSMRILLKLALAISCLYCNIAYANPLALTENQKEYNLTSVMEYWIAPNKTVDPRTFSLIEQSKLFKKDQQSSRELNVGFVNEAVWIRVSLQQIANTNSRWILEIPYLGLDAVSLYTPDEKILRNGANTQVEERPYFSRFYAFPIDLKEGVQTYYLKVESAYPMTIPLRLVEMSVFNRTQFTENLIQSLYYGELLSLLLYNLALFLIIRDKKYFLYSLFAATTGLAIFAGNGYARLYLWPGSPQWDEISQSTLLSISAGLALIFTMWFLNTRQYLPITNNLMRFLVACFFTLSLVLIATLIFPIPRSPIYLSIFTLTLLAPSIAFYCSIRNMFNRTQGSVYFLIGWGTLCIGSFTAALRIFDMVPSNGFTLYALQISSAIEMLLFSFALANRFQHERIQREEAQFALLASKEETVNAMRLTEERLEHAVDTRTQKLQELLLSEQYMREQYVRFGAMIAHEFRNPLNIIGAQTTMLEIEPQAPAEKILKRASVIHGAVDRLVKLFDQWLESDRLSQSNTHINKIKITLQGWLSTLVENSRTYHPDHSLALIPFQEDIRIEADDHLLQIAVLNLIDNACKYSAANTEITIGIVNDDYGVGIYVRDQGPGIEENMQAKILEPYVRIADNNQTQGTGLGLAFVKRIMDVHDGRIQIDSRPDQGTTITLWLPEG